MNLIKCNNYDEMSAQAAKIIAAQLMKKPNCVLGLPTGSTPLGVYGILVQMNKNDKIDFTKVKTFNLDEYYPISKKNTQSYHFFMHDNFFNHINIDEQNVNILNGEAENPQIECELYEEKIKNSGGIDLQLLGIGQNGHIGFNEPGKALKSKTHLIELTQNTINANSRFFEKTEDVPKKSLTMGIGTIMKAKEIVIIASGREKANAVYELLSGEITTANPSTILNAHNNVTLIADAAALGEN
ncbi:MAG: glucosamine-6-phosphate deaminase [Firmicutes bacterium]|nr:glucosamine-6-phosphate deaminase [Bacillota bacterium]